MASLNAVIWAYRKVRQREFLYLPAQLVYFITSRFFSSKRYLNYLAKREFDYCHQNNGHRSHNTLPQLDSSRWHWDSNDIGRIVSSVSEIQKNHTIKKAETILKGQFEFRSKVGFKAENFNWNPIGMTKGWTWDLNRHNWFVTLAFAFRYTNDRRFIDEFVRYFEDWVNSFISQGILPKNDNPFEVAARINAWLWVYFILHEEELWEISSKRRFISGLRFLCCHLYNTIEYIAPGNHVLLEAKALALSGECFGDTPFGLRLRRRGSWYLERELNKQVCEDGVHAERSTMYHRIIAGEIGELRAYYSKFRPELFTRLNAISIKMAQFVAYTENSNGTFALFGDAHLEDTYYRFNPIRLFGLVSDYSGRFENKFCDYTDWLIWAYRAERKLLVNTLDDQYSKYFTDGGYYIVRSGWHRNSDVLVWDCGQVGYWANRKHAHADSLSFTLSVEGQFLFFDPGMDEAKSPELLLRSTRSHNTIVVDEQDSSVLSARNEIWNPAISSPHQVHHEGDVTILAGSHNGYRGLKQPVIVLRAIVIASDMYWLCVDFISGVGTHLVSQYFQLAPEVHAKLDGDCAILSSGSLDNKYFIQFLCDNYQRVTNEKGTRVNISTEDRTAGQYSGRKQEYKAIKSLYSGIMPVVMTACIFKEDSHISVDQHLMRDDFVISIKGKSLHHRLNFKHSNLTTGNTLVDPIRFERVL